MSFRPLLKSAWQRVQRVYAVRDNVQIGANAHIGIGSILWAPRRLVVGHDVYIGKNCTIECNGTIGNHVLIANLVGIVGRLDHDYREVGTPVRSAAWVGDAGKAEQSGEVTIEDDVWLGYACVVLSGSRVARGTIVAAGSVVRDTTLPYSIMAGSPARQVSWRFNRAEATQHETRLYGGVISDLSHLPSGEQA